MAASKVSARQIVATITPKTGTTSPKWTGFKFPQVSGGEITASVEKVYAGGTMFPSLLCAPAEIGDISLTAYYDDSSDGTLTDDGDNIAAKINHLRQRVGRAFYDIDISIYNCDIQQPGSDRQYKDALVVALSEPDGDASSGAPAMFSMTFSVQNVSTPSKAT